MKDQAVIDLHIYPHGYYRCTAAELDAQMAKQLPASVNQLRDRLSEQVPDIDYSDVHTVTEFLVIFADIEVA